MCVYPNCLKPMRNAFALVCEDHRAERQAECEKMRSNPNYRPNNPYCALAPHVWAENCQCRGKDFYGGQCKPCRECHYCGLAHKPILAA